VLPGEKRDKLRFGWGFEPVVGSTPSEPDFVRVQCLIGQEEDPALLFGQEPIDKRQVELLVRAVNLVSYNGVSFRREMDANLMFASGVWLNAQEGETCIPFFEPALDPILGQGGRAVGTDSVLDCNRAGLIPA